MKRKTQVCRICLKPEEKEIYKRFFEGNNSLASSLFLISGIMIVELNNQPPHAICKKCHKDLTAAVKFLELAKKSNQFFKKQTKDDEIKLWKTEAKKEVEDLTTLMPAIALKEEEDEVQEGFFEDDNFANDIDDGSIEDFFEPLPQTDTNPEKPKKPKKNYRASAKFRCWCGAQLSGGKRLREHQIARHEEVPMSERPRCDICGKDFKIQPYLVSHMKSRHSDQKDTKKIPCSVCGKLLGKGALKLHEERHELMKGPEDPRNFECELCGHRTTMKHYMQQHIERIHLKLKKFKCKQCPAEFVHGALLDYHKRKHLNLRFYTCRFCDKSFTRKFCCQIHERIHTNDRPYSCRFCDRTFIHHSDHRRHELRHTGGISKRDFDAKLAAGNATIYPVV